MIYRGFTIFILLLLSHWVQADGLKFSETMKGYGIRYGIYDDLRVDLDVTINDIVEWQDNPSHSAGIDGTLTFGNESASVIGTLNILEESSFACTEETNCYHLVYRLVINSPDFPPYFVGFKTVRDDDGIDILDDMTTLQGCFSNYYWLPLYYYDQPHCRSELVFEWWDFWTLWDFTWSFDVIDTPWWRHWSVKRTFLEIIFGNLARTYFPWMFF